MRPKKRFFQLIIPIMIIVFFAVGFLFAPHNPATTNLMHKLEEPSADYPLGTDALGRCVLSRLLYAGKTTLGIVLIGSVVVFFVGTFLGLLLGGGSAGHNPIVDGFLNAVTALPPVAYLIVFIGAWGNGITTVMIAVVGSLVLRLIKLVKAKTELEMEKAYVRCAICSGASTPKVLFRHILPNIVLSIVHFIILSCADMVAVISAFSFIGLGLGDNAIDWGRMIVSARSVMLTRPALMLMPVACVFVSALCFNLMGQALEEEVAAC
ncbi:ABC transporter permease [Fusibacter sp. JL298sf-3]